MKSKLAILASVAVFTILSAAAQPRIAVLDFSAGVNVNQSDVDGLSAIFNTYFEPQGYTIVERTRVNRILEEHKIQSGKITETEMSRLGEILNVPVIVIGDVNLAMKQYNIDIRAVNVETGAIIAKDGAEWAEGTSYRETMRAIAERMSAKIPLIEFYRPPAPEPTPEKEETKVADHRYRSTGSYLRFSVGAPDILASIAYNYQITSSFMIGAGAGLGLTGNTLIEEGEDVHYESKELHESAAMPIFAEIEYRTPLYRWSLFANAKTGYMMFAPEDKIHRWGLYRKDTEEYNRFFANLTLGVGYKNLNFGFGYSTNYYVFGFISYSLPCKNLFKAFF